jgi:hypothetical protein
MWSVHTTALCVDVSASTIARHDHIASRIFDNARDATGAQQGEGGPWHEVRVPKRGERLVPVKMKFLATAMHCPSRLVLHEGLTGASVTCVNVHCPLISHAKRPTRASPLMPSDRRVCARVTCVDTVLGRSACLHPMAGKGRGRARRDVQRCHACRTPVIPRRWWRRTRPRAPH